ncbi:MAG: DsbA family protein [Lacisediminimonas sp.]|nr:DsbA family protein [Lacisediminimonas sp.]
MQNQMKVDLYWSFRSPYSYLVMPRVMALAQTGKMQWNVKIVSPLAIRYPEHFRKLHPLNRPYFHHDCVRTAEALGMPFRRPVPDPIIQDPVTLAIATEQPVMVHLARLGIAATRRGRALPFIDEISRLLWDGRIDDWNLGEHMAGAAARAGLDLAELEADIRRDAAALDEAIVQHEREQALGGHWGVPMFVFDGEPFFGQDRFDQLMWRLRKNGLDVDPASLPGIQYQDRNRQSLASWPRHAG